MSPSIKVGGLGQQRKSLAEMMQYLEKSKRMMEMVAMNGLRPGVAWFYCIIFITAGNGICFFCHHLWVLQRSIRQQ